MGQLKKAPSKSPVKLCLQVPRGPTRIGSAATQPHNYRLKPFLLGGGGGVQAERVWYVWVYVHVRLLGRESFSWMGGSVAHPWGWG